MADGTRRIPKASPATRWSGHPPPHHSDPLLQGKVAPFKSGLQCFHNFAAKRDAALGVLGPGKLSPASKAYWAAIKAEWESLDESERIKFHSLAHVVADQALSAKMQQQLAPCSIPEPEPEQAIVAQADTDRSVELVARTGGYTDSATSPKTDLPMTTELFERLLNQEAASFVAETSPDIVSSFRSKRSRVAAAFRKESTGLAKARGTIPVVVPYSRPCAGVCRMHAHPSCASLADQLEADITRRVQGQRLEDLDFLMAIEATCCTRAHFHSPWPTISRRLRLNLQCLDN